MNPILPKQLRKIDVGYERGSVNLPLKNLHCKLCKAAVACVTMYTFQLLCRAR